MAKPVTVQNLWDAAKKDASQRFLKDFETTFNISATELDEDTDLSTLEPRMSSPLTQARTVSEAWELAKKQATQEFMARIRHEYGVDPTDLDADEDLSSYKQGNEALRAPGPQATPAPVAEPQPDGGDDELSFLPSEETVRRGLQAVGEGLKKVDEFANRPEVKVALEARKAVKDVFNDDEGDEPVGTFVDRGLVRGAGRTLGAFEGVVTPLVGEPLQLQEAERARKIVEAGGDEMIVDDLDEWGQPRRTSVKVGPPKRTEFNLIEVALNAMPPELRDQVRKDVQPKPQAVEPTRTIPLPLPTMDEGKLAKRVEQTKVLIDNHIRRQEKEIAKEQPDGFFDWFYQGAKDIGDIAEGLTVLVATLSGFGETFGEEQASRKGYGELFKESFNRVGRPFGEQIGTGAVAELAAIAEDPIDAFQSKPATTFLTLMPFVAAGRAGALKLPDTPKVGKLVQAVDTFDARFRDWLKDKASKVTPETAKDFSAWLKRTFVDPAQQREQAATELTDALIRDSKIPEAIVTGGMERVANQAKQGRVSAKSEVLSPVEGAEVRGLSPDDVDPLEVDLPRLSDMGEKVPLREPNAPLIRNRGLVDDADVSPQTGAISLARRRADDMDSAQQAVTNLEQGTLAPEVMTRLSDETGLTPEQVTAELDLPKFRPEEARKAVEETFDDPPIFEVEQVRVKPRLSPEAVRAVDDIARALARQDDPDGVAIRTEITQEIADAVSNKIPSILRSPKLRKEVLRRLDAIAKDQGFTRSQRRQLLKDGEKVLRDVMAKKQVDVSLTIGQVTVNLLDEVATEALDSSPEFRGEVLAESVQVAGERLARKKQQDFIQERFREEMGERRTAKEEAARVIDAVTQGESLPAVLRQAPETVSSYIFEAHGSLVNALVEAGKTPAQAKRILRQAVRRLRSYRPVGHKSSFKVTEKIQGRLGVEPVNPRIREHLGLKETDTDVYVPQGVNDTLGWQVAAMDAIQSPSWWGRFTRAMKANLTARNPTTLINNVLANVAHQTIRRGEPMNPATLIQMAREWKAFKDGTLKDPAKVEMFRAIEQSGMMDATQVEAELGGLDRAGKLLGDGLDKINRPLEAAYKFSDEVFKLDEAIRQYDNVKDFLGRLDVGEWLRVEVSPAKKVTVEKTPDGFVARGDGGKVRKLTDQDVNNLAARAGAAQANRIFFDYRDLPNFPMVIRSIPIVGVISPFYSFFAKSLWVPGMKPGLAGEWFGNVLRVESNNPGVMAAKAAGDAAGLGRAISVVNGTRAYLLESEEGREEVKKLLTWLPGDQRVMLLNQITNPAWAGLGNLFEEENFDTVNAGDATMTLARVLLGTAVGIKKKLGIDGYAFEDLYPGVIEKDSFLWVDGIPPEMKERLAQSGLVGEAEGSPNVMDRATASINFTNDQLKNLSPEARQSIERKRKLWMQYVKGELVRPTDFLELAGVAGSPILDTVQMLQRADRQGTSLSAADYWRAWGPLALGGGLAKVVDVGMTATGYADPTNPLYQMSQGRRRLLKGDPVATDFIRDAVRVLTGIGWRIQKDNEVADRYFSGLHRQLEASLIRPLEDDIKAAKLNGRPASEIREAELFFQAVKEIIQQEVTRAKYANEEARKLLVRQNPQSKELKQVREGGIPTDELPPFEPLP